MTMIAKKVAWSPMTALPSPSNIYIYNNENLIVTKNQYFVYHKMWLYFYLQHYLGNSHCRRLLYSIMLLYRFFIQYGEKNPIVCRSKFGSTQDSKPGNASADSDAMSPQLREKIELYSGSPFWVWDKWLKRYSFLLVRLK